MIFFTKYVHGTQAMADFKPSFNMNVQVEVFMDSAGASTDLFRPVSAILLGFLDSYSFRV